MSNRIRLSVILVAGAAMLLISTAGAYLSASAGAWWNWSAGAQVSSGLNTDQAPRPRPRREDMGVQSKTMVAPDAPYAEQVEQQFANYDRVVVEVHRDGSLCVLGKTMPMDSFRSFLGDQQHEGLKTVVAIRPESDCMYQHIGRVIRLCQDLGIPHLMETEPVPRTAVAEPVTSV